MKKTSVLKSSIISSFSVVWLLLTLLNMQSCNKMEINDGLDGKWQVIEVIQDGKSIDLPVNNQFYYNFYLHVCQLGREYGYIPAFTANMKYSNDVIALDFPLIKSGTATESEIKSLRYWGVDASGETVFHVDQLSRSKLVISRSGVTVICRRY